MNHLQKFSSQIQAHLILILLANNVLVIGSFWVASEPFGLSTLTSLGIAAFVALVGTLIWATIGTKVTVKPVKALQTGILENNDLSQEPNSIIDPEKLHIGRELVVGLLAQVRQMANVAEGLHKENESAKTDLSSNFIANKLPLSMAVLDENQNIIFANDIMAQYIGLKSAEEIIGKNAYTLLDMSFLSAFTLDAWLDAAKVNKPTAVQTWERVKMVLPDDNHTVKLFDLAAYYNHDNPNHYETILVFFDHTDQYSQDDQAMSFVALSVHELRTPLTLLRGYIEVFKDELTYKIDPELIGFLNKMDASAQQLTYFVNNILNVARIEQTGLELELREEDWPTIIRSAVEDMSLRASVRGLHISTDIAENLPKVGADRVSIYEVICNLLDNALKYSGTSKNIIIRSYITPEGNIETTVEDQGVGIPSASMRNLFDKFYRDHHKRDTIGGTGLGLYLSKIIVGAHGGHIWVKSKEGEGSTFGFTLTPFDKLAAENKNSDNGPIVRGAHGWIKNHSLYRG